MFATDRFGFEIFVMKHHFLFEKSMIHQPFFKQIEAYSLLIMWTRKEKKVLMNQTNQSR